jgi:hypothetical protein
MKNEKELRELFKNRSDCYADTGNYEHDGSYTEGEVIQAITEDRFIEILKEANLLVSEEPFPIEEMKFGLIAIDRREIENDPDVDPTILHFCGYKEPINQKVVDELYRDLTEDTRFGLSDIIEFIDVYEAPEAVIEMFK